jgi:hypothetical protein
MYELGTDPGQAIRCAQSDAHNLMGRVFRTMKTKTARINFKRGRHLPSACPSDKPRKRVTPQVAAKGWGQRVFYELRRLPHLNFIKRILAIALLLSAPLAFAKKAATTARNRKGF